MTITMLTKDFFSLFRRRWVYLALALYASGLLYVTLHTQLIFEDEGSKSREKVPRPSKSPFPSIAHSLDVFRHPITAPNLTLTSGDTFLLPYPSSPDGHRFKQTLGKRILILDVDTRPLNNSGEILNSTWSPDETNLWATAGRLNHYLFAQLHGYDYKFMQMPTFSGMHGTWSKVSAVREHLYLHDFVVFVDADTIFPHPHVSLEWLFNYWEIAPDNLIAMALDPQDPINNDFRGRTLLNTGFIVAQQSPRAHELLTAWESCPLEVKYPGCSNFSYSWPHEQGAFGNFLRYDFNRPDDVKSLKCAEANGCPEVAHTGCSGKLVRHYWGSKASVPSAVQESIVQYFLTSLHEEFHQDYANIVYTTHGNPNPSPAGDGNFTPDISQKPGSEIQALTQEDVRETIETSPILNP